jgi:two-component system sensor kinase FixL
VVEHKDRAAEKISHIRGAISALAPLAPQTVALRDVVEGAIAGVAEEMAAATVRLEVGGVPDLARLPLSRVELELVFIQLFRNAIEAMVSVKSRTLTVRCQAEGARWLAEVEDTGPGIDEDQAARLFDLFFTTKAAADGVGLSIGRSIVARAGGKLMLASTGPGGSTFRIELPFALADGV